MVDSDNDTRLEVSKTKDVSSLSNTRNTFPQGEEAMVKKKPITETKTITKDVTHEEIKYDDNKSNS